MVKYLGFGLALLLGVPFMTAGAVMSRRLRGWLLAGLVFSTVLGDIASINFMSTEHYRGPDRGFEITLTDLIVLALFLYLILRQRREIRWAPFNTLPMLGLFVVACVSVAFSARPILGLFTLTKLVRLYMVYWIIVNSLRAGISPEAIRDGLVLMALFLLVVVLKQKYVNGLYRVPGMFDHSNSIPPYLNTVIPVMTLWGLGGWGVTRRQAAVILIATLGMLFCVLATQSRAGMVLAGGGFLAAVIVANLRLPSRRTRIASVFTVVLMVFGGLFATKTIIRRFQQAPETSKQARNEFNVVARMMASDHMLGVGVNTFSHALTSSPEYKRHISVMKHEQQAGVAHHMYWLTAAEIGWIGLAGFLLVILRLWWQELRGSWKISRPEGVLLGGLALGVLALHLQGFLEWSLRITPVAYMFAITSGLGVGLANIARGQRSKPKTPKRVRP